MNIRQMAVSVAAVALLCLALCFPSWAAAAGAGEIGFTLTKQSLHNPRQDGLPNNISKMFETIKDRKIDTNNEFLMAAKQETGQDQTVRYSEPILIHASDESSGETKHITDAPGAQNRELGNRLAELKVAQDGPAPKQAEAESKKLKELEQRVKELEDAEAAREVATRSIIRDAMSTVGSKINESVSMGGTLEVLFGGAQVFQGRSERVLRLNTAQLDFSIQANDWTQGTFVIEYNDGRDTSFITSEGSEKTVDRINLDRAFLTIGDMQRFPPFLSAGRMVVPFGISTGNPVADVPTIQDPLTIEVFETREDAILFGVGLPTPPLTPPSPPVIPPPVRPLVINPLIGSISKALGYKPLPPPPPTPITPTPPPPLFNGGVFLYNGDTVRIRKNSRVSENWGATLGFRTQGNCGRPFDQLRGSAFCPWSIDIDVDYNNSVFDTLFLESEYQDFLRQIGFVRGMAASVKAVLGPVGLVAEWDGAIDNAIFADDLGTLVNIKPRAWQVSLAYQFDWNPWVESIAAQGSYLALGYSESRDLAGVTRVINGINNRVGAVPKRRFLVSVGEWVLDGVRISFEYSYNVDYPKNERGTGNSADGFFCELTYEW